MTNNDVYMYLDRVNSDVCFGFTERIDYNFGYRMCERMEADGYTRIYFFSNKYLPSHISNHPIGVKVLNSGWVGSLELKVDECEIVLPFNNNIKGVGRWCDEIHNKINKLYSFYISSVEDSNDKR